MNLYDMNEPAVRAKVFWLLRRLTSYSLWMRKRDAWERFTHAYENALKTWPKSQEEQIEADALDRAYGALGQFDKGLGELEKGRRYVWRVEQPLNVAWKVSASMRTNLYRHPAYWERGIQMEPWPPKIEALHQLLIKSFYQGDQTPLEVLPQQRVSQAKWSWAEPLLDSEFYKKDFYTLPYPVFPDQLPQLPEARDLEIVSGQEVPVDGIWEPIRDERTRILGIIAVGERKIENNGCFNYFVGGTTAPKYSSESGPVSTRWRLLWEDDRYKDGRILDESEYFIEPKLGKSDEVVEGNIEVKTGEVCPKSGLWAARDHESAPISVKAGSVMPDLLLKDHLGEPIVRWVVWKLVKPD
ncbi:hypothetical protein G3N59_26450 [Paraburkholderia sp. Ac-20340]|uniref:Imm72 family immunity protein n=1 Tax=Paraburkholderia sp. Ac-20340 TaxID=2703888 RepID=UPI0019815F4E|nr:Imm72 family immunity protein [Paraburkholderia sp. Ac-20340]MBN3856926.1 hypothetical protein [Paraburkholderia sp. Ac-20340]